MPQNKRESLIYTVMMCFVMVLWMSFYNVFIRTLKFDTSIFTESWLGFPLAYIVALCCDLLFVSRTAKFIAFKWIKIKPQSPTIVKVLAISGVMVVFMVLIMSFYGSIVACVATNEWKNLFFIYINTVWKNFLMAFPFQILVAGTLVRFVFRKLFPVGSIK